MINFSSSFGAFYFRAKFTISYVSKKLSLLSVTVIIQKTHTIQMTTTESLWNPDKSARPSLLTTIGIN
jgi:hypothetical protein